MEHQPGPRDWSPSENSWGGRPSMPTPGEVKRSLRGHAAISLALGLLSLALGVAAVLPTAGTWLHAWYLASCGIGAIGIAIRTIRFPRLAGKPASFAAWAGAFTGGVGLVLLLVGAIIPPLAPSYGAPGVGATDAPVVEEPLSPPNADEGYVSSALELARYAGTIAYLLEQVHDSYGIYPSEMEPIAGDTIVTPAGNVELPPGVTFTYTAAADSSQYEMVLFDPRSQQGATFNSEAGQVLPFEGSPPES